MIADVLDFLVVLNRLAAPGERARRVRAAEQAEQQLEKDLPGVRSRVRALVAAAESDGPDNDLAVEAILLGRA
jgi:hypothetical protein